MAELTATASCAALSAVVESSGQRVGERLLAVRVGWLTGLIAGMAARVVAAHWTGRDLDTLSAGVGADGRGLPGKGWMALRRLGWTAVMPDGVYAGDRVHRRHILKAIIATWPEGGGREDADWQRLRELRPPSACAGPAAESAAARQPADRTTVRSRRRRDQRRTAPRRRPRRSPAGQPP
jgi:hypothetical protein